MCKLSYEKCICFIFLVILAILRCSGFRTDRSAMSEITKHNTIYTSNSLSTDSSDFLRKLFFTSGNRYKREENKFTLTNFQKPQRIRHSRRQKAQARKRPTGRIEMRIIRPSEISYDTNMRTHSTLTPFASQNFAQISPSDYHQLQPTASLVARSQRSSNRNGRRERNRTSNCQEQDVARKAYRANTVVLAKAESMSSNRVHNYSVSFRILEVFKQADRLDDTLRLTFINDTKRMNCESELNSRTHGLVKAQIQQSKEYFLFLNSTGRHRYSVLGMPVMKKRKRNKDLKNISRVIRPNFGKLFK